MASFTLRQLCDALVKADLNPNSRFPDERAILLPRLDNIILSTTYKSLIERNQDVLSASTNNSFYNTSFTFFWLHRVERLKNGFTKDEFCSSCHCLDTWDWLKRGGIIQVSHNIGRVYYYKSIYADQYLDYYKIGTRNQRSFLY